MSRPTLEVADIVRAAGNSFWERQQSHLAWPHRKVLDAIVRCRTAALGGHRDQCVRCGHQAISFNSCRNRHCPKCQGNARAKWLAARSAELLPVPYFHVVFTLPHELSALVLQNKRLLYDLLYRTSAARPCSNWLAIRSALEPTSDFSACSIPGDRTSSIIPMSTTSFPQAAWLSMAPDGSIPRATPSCPRGWFASDTSDSSPTAGEVLRSNVAALCLVRRPVSIRTSSPACAVRPAPASCWSSNG
jgi:hypothetical protein